MREELEDKGAIFQTTVDSEIILHLLAQPTIGGNENNLVQTVRRIEGAYSLVIMTEQELIGVRDPFGFRPLCLGRVGDAWVLASETCALDLISAKFERDVEPGEIVIIDKNGLRSAAGLSRAQRGAPSAFSNTSISPGRTAPSPTATSIRCAWKWAANWRANIRMQADLVVPVPDSGNCAALGYSLESGIPFEMAFVRNHYVGRSFLQPSQLIRDFDVRVKLNLITELVKGKRVIVVDDSIVRGTTCKARVNNLKEAGAKEVHVLVSCPPHMNPCVYGIDFPDRSKLMAANHSLDEIRRYLNADSLAYLSEDGMVRATGLPEDSFCMACYNGKYPVPYDAANGQDTSWNAAARASRVWCPLWKKSKNKSNSSENSGAIAKKWQRRPAADAFGRTLAFRSVTVPVAAFGVPPAEPFIRKRNKLQRTQRGRPQRKIWTGVFMSFALPMFHSNFLPKFLSTGKPGLLKYSYPHRPSSMRVRAD